MPNLEDQAYWQRNFERNQSLLAPGQHTYNTHLSPIDEGQFRGWLKANKVPFSPDLAYTDYDMRGFWQALQAKDPRAQSAIDPNDQQLHYPDYWKTPYAATFSAESQWANPNKAPRWVGDRLTMPDGTVLWDDKKQQWLGPEAPWSPSDQELLKNWYIGP